MSEPFLERLSRLTPDAGGLDRDALLYAAGCSSARPNRGWIALAGALAVSQVVSLFLLWPRADERNVQAQGADTPRSAGEVPGPPASPPELPSYEEPDRRGLWTARI